MNDSQVTELLLQSLEHEKGGVLVYQSALKCAVNEDLKEEWEKYLDETTHHVEVLMEVCTAMGLDSETPSPGRSIVKKLGKALILAMEEARSAGSPEAAQLVACECVVLAETKDHLNWELIGRCADQMDGDDAAVLQQAYNEIEDQEDEHLYHTMGWCRELWIESLGMKAILPPLEEIKHVKTAIGAAKAEQASDKAR